jgi:hypothetical protein
LSINLYLLDEEHLCTLLDCTFPYLIDLWLLEKLRAKHLAAATSFLLRHPQLISLSMPPPAADKLPCQIPLWSLQRFRGPAKFLPFLQAPRIAEAWIDWDFLDPHRIEPTIIALKSMARGGVPFICSNEYFGSRATAILDALAKHMPRMKTLQLRVSVSDSDRVAVFFSPLFPYS